MRTRLYATLGVIGMASLLAGCVSLKRTPEARFFVLQSLVAPPAVAESAEPVGIIGLETVRLPGHLERPQLVTWTAPNELSIDEFLRWAEPLKQGITRTLAEDVAALLPDHQIVRRPWPGDTRTRCRVQVSLRVFGLQRSGMVELEGGWTLLPDQGALALRQQPVSLRRGPLPGGEGGAPPTTGVDVMSELLADLSRQIADAIRALPPEDAPVPALDSATSEPTEGP